LTWSFAGWGVATILVSAVPGAAAPAWMTLGSLLVLRGALGVLQAPLFPVCIGGTIAAWLPPVHWGLANGIVNFGFTFATAAAAPIGAWLVLTLGWRQAIIIAGPAALALAATWWWYNRDDPRDHARVNDEELAIIAAGRPITASPGRGRWVEVLTDRTLMLLTASYFAINYPYYLFFSWFYYYLTEVRHVPPQLAGYFSATQWIIAAAATIAGGILCDGLSTAYGASRGCRMTAVGGILFGIPCLAIGAVTTQPVMMVVLLSISFASTMLVDSAYWVAAMRIAGRRAPLATGVLNTGGNLSGTVAALLVPLVARALGWVAAIESAVVFAGAAALVWVWIAADEPEPVGV
jgi:ACS family glucarate transporter-like MFS transporter